MRAKSLWVGYIAAVFTGTVLSLVLVYVCAPLGAPKDRTLCRVNQSAMRELDEALLEHQWKRVVRILRTPTHILIDGPNPKHYAALAAMDALVEVRSDVTPTLVRYGLRDHDPQVRYMSMCVMGFVGSNQDVKDVLGVLRKEEDLRVVVCGAQALCLLADTAEAKPLVAMGLAECCHPLVLYGNPLVPKRFAISTCELAEYLNRRFKLGLDVPAECYKYYTPIDEDIYPRAGK
jgi:hypothetical protein